MAASSPTGIGPRKPAGTGPGNGETSASPTEEEQPDENRTELAARSTISRNNLKQLVIAMHSMHDNIVSNIIRLSRMIL